MSDERRGAIRALASSTAGRAAAAVTLLAFALGWVPVLSRPGYELGLVLGVLVPPIVAVASGLDALGATRSPFDAVRRALQYGASVAIALALSASIHGARTGFCDPVEGLATLALGPLSGVVLASVWGALSSFVALYVGARRPRGWTVAAALAGPVGALVVAVIGFYATPMVFAYEPFVGFFSGALYDTIIPWEGLWSYRLASLGTLSAVAVLAYHLEVTDGRLALVTRSRPGLVTLGVVAAVASLGSVLGGDRLGHWHTAHTIAQALGSTSSSDHCRVVHEASLAAEARLLARECDEHLRDLSAQLEIGRPPRVTAYLFRNPEQRRWFMGAHHTAIAKPWRAEVYLESDEFPHRVLRHELAHVLGAEFARGPFRVPARFGGLLPDPGLIEGFAEWLAPRDDELSAAEWAAAMRRIGVLPPLRTLFGLGFLAGGASTSYTTAGAFIRHVSDRFGPSAIRRWYGGEDLAAICGASFDELERGWWLELDEVPLSDAVLTEARRRFDRPGVLGRSCPHAVDRLLLEAGARETGDPDAARGLYEKALALDPGNHRALFGVPACQDRGGRAEDARETLEALTTHPALTEPVRANAFEKLGDLALRAGNLDQAASSYREAEARTFDEGRLRTLELKARYTADQLGRRALVSLLVGEDADGPNSVEALDRLGEWRASTTSDGVPSYLLGRQLVNAGRWSQAIERLDESLARPLPRRTEAEALRLRIRAALVEPDCPAALRTASRHARLAQVAAARKAYWRSLVARACPKSISSLDEAR